MTQNTPIIVMGWSKCKEKKSLWRALSLCTYMTNQWVNPLGQLVFDELKCLGFKSSCGHSSYFISAQKNNPYEWIKES